MGKQEEIDIFMKHYGLYIEPEYRFFDLVSELGEVAKQVIVQTEYGDKDIEKTEYLEEEFGDLYFSLIALANSLNIDLDIALEKVKEKYKKRINGTGDPGSE